MMRPLLGLILSLFYFLPTHATPNTSYLGSREADPTTIIENVSVIHGDYTEIEVDLTVPSPDSLLLSRFYSSKDTLEVASFGGWRFNPHCFLQVEKDSYAYVGNPDGTILTYVRCKNTAKRSLFKIDPEGEVAGLVNTAKGEISLWTNLKNNELYFDPDTDTFELLLSSEGKRFYAKHPSLDCYFLTHEILPSGNKLFYEFDANGRLILIKQTNSWEKKVLAWIKIEYGDEVLALTSDGKSALYRFEKDPSGASLLSEVIRSHKPSLQYEYQVIEKRALLEKKSLPEGRFIEVCYGGDDYRVSSVTTPLIASLQFSYARGATTVDGYGSRKTVYRFNKDFQLTAAEQYLNGILYRSHKKSWGKKGDAGNLITTSLEDANGNILYHKHFTYGSRGNIVEEREWGDIAGTGPIPLIIDDEGLVTNQKGHVRYYSYFSGKTTHGFFQKDDQGAGVKHWYKKGTNLLLKKFILTSGSADAENEGDNPGIQQRHFYTYNEDAALTRLIVDDGLITDISPKQDLPNVGAPKVIQQKYSSPDGKSEFLLKKTVNEFDDQGNIVSQAVYDANQEHRYTVTKGYEQGSLLFETDPIGNKTLYSYDENQNLLSETDGDASIEYEYDLRNRCISVSQKDIKDSRFTTSVSYDAAGNLLTETDHLGGQTLYVNDDLGRPIHITHPNSSAYTYTYDLFDHQTSVTGPEGKILRTSYNVHGQLAKTQHLDGTSEIFRYDSGGNLREHYCQNGTLENFEYDDFGRLQNVYFYKRDAPDRTFWKDKSYSYDAFHKISEIDERSNKTSYTYDGAGRLIGVKKGEQKVELSYDPLGRTRAVKKWRSPNQFTLEIKEYDLLNRVIEERIEGAEGKIFFKKGYVYNKESIEEGQKGYKRITIDPSGSQTEEVFASDGNLIEITKKGKSGQKLNSIEMSYDSLGNKIVERSEGYETAWSFNQKNQLESITSGKGLPEARTTRFTYNGYGDPITKSSPGASDPIAYRYNNSANLQELSYEGTLYTLQYDEKNNLTCLNRNKSPWLEYTFDENELPLSETITDEFGSYTISCSYDGQGEISSIELPGGSSVKYSYDGPFVTTISRFNEEEELLYKHKIAERDLLGNILKEILPGNLGEKTYSWDAAGRKIAITTDFFQDKREYDLSGMVKKRETSLGGETRSTDYTYNDLMQLTAEQGHVYSYDSIGNRLQKDGISYKVDGLNQLIEAGDVSYTFHPAGNIATKTINGKSWVYKSNRLNQITSITDPEQNTISFTYDLTGRRLTKRVESKGKKPKTLRFFYLGNTEVGSLDEKGKIVELKIPSDPNNPEAPSIAIEIKKEIYVPLYDLQGNIACLLDRQKQKVVESNHYSAYGEEIVSHSSLHNPWRYLGKRVDEETGLVYFGYRYYDPEIGRWISPDPLGTIDGPNLYAFVHNNPIKYVDYFGLAATIAEGCGCTKHDHPGWHNAPPSCVCICSRDLIQTTYAIKAGTKIKSALCGAGHGIVDFTLSSLHDLHTVATYVGVREIEMALHERAQIIEALFESQANQKAAIEETLMNFFSIDDSDAIYHSFRSKTTMGLEVGSLVAGGYGAVKGVVRVSRLTRMPMQITKAARLSSKQLRGGNKFLGHKGFELKNPPYQNLRNQPTIIQGRSYSGHALDRMQDRGFMPSVIEQTIKNGSHSIGRYPGTMVYYDAVNDVKAVLNTEGKIVTISYGDINR